MPDERLDVGIVATLVDRLGTPRVVIAEAFGRVGSDIYLDSYANARLIAAAPDLYAACRAVLDGFDSGVLCRNTDSDGCSDWALRAAPALTALAQMKAAITKAEGQS